MGGVILLLEIAANYHFGNWLTQPYSIKIPIFMTLCFISLASFVIMAKIVGVLDITEIAKTLLKKRKNNAGKA